MWKLLQKVLSKEEYVEWREYENTLDKMSLQQYKKIIKQDHEYVEG